MDAMGLPKPALSRTKKVLFGLLTALLLLALFEGGARLVGGRPPPWDMAVRVSQCSVAADAQHVALACPVTDMPLPRYPRQPRRPRVVFLGGSSMVGGHTSVPAAVQRLLPEVEVVNFAAPGLGAANVASLSAQSAAASPSLVVIYSGHNDYNQDTFRGAIQATRLWLVPVYQLLQESWLHALVVRGTSPPPLFSMHRRPSGQLLVTRDDLVLRSRAALDERFESDLTLAVRSAAAPVLLATVMSNSDWPPTGVLATAGHPACASEARHLMGPNQSYRQRADKARRACGDGALTRWLQHKDLVARGKLKQAVVAYRASLDQDPVPLRAPSSANRIIHRVARATGARVVDLDASIGPLARGTLFVDTLHFSEAGARAVADKLAPEIQRALRAAGSLK